MRRRGVGMAAVKKRQQEAKQYKAVGSAMAAENLEHVEATLDMFRTSLEDFARKHKKAINSDPAFRQQFQVMCSKIGVDPLASSKGFWAELLGVGDFYYELAVQITEVCLRTRAVNGGLMSLPELLARVREKRQRHQQAVSVDDAKRAISKLKVLGSGFALLEAGSAAYVVSVPRELNADHGALLVQAEAKGFVKVSAVASVLYWPTERVERALRSLGEEGMVWVDQQGFRDRDGSGKALRPSVGEEGGEEGGGNEDLYWFPSLWQGEKLLG